MYQRRDEKQKLYGPEPDFIFNFFFPAEKKSQKYKKTSGAPKGGTGGLSFFYTFYCCLFYLYTPWRSPSLSSIHSAIIRTPSRNPKIKFSCAVIPLIRCCVSVSSSRIFCSALSSLFISCATQSAALPINRRSSESGAIFCSSGARLPW